MGFLNYFSDILDEGRIRPFPLRVFATPYIYSSDVITCTQALSLISFAYNWYRRNIIIINFLLIQ